MVKGNTIFILSGTAREAFLYIRCNAGNGFTYTCRDNLQGSLSPNDGGREKSSFPLFTVTPETEQTYIRAWTMDDYCRLGRPWFTLLGTMVVTGKYHHRSPPSLVIASTWCYYIVLIWGAMVPPPFWSGTAASFFYWLTESWKKNIWKFWKGLASSGALRNSFSSEGDMWQGVEYTAAPGGMEEAIKNYCKKEIGEPLLFFPGKCTKIPAGLLPQEITGIFSMKKDMTQISCHIFCFR